MNLQEKLVYLRKENNLSQMDVAEKLNVSRQAISRWEVGGAVPSTDNLRALSTIYDVSVDYLLNDNAKHQAQGDDSPEAGQEEQKQEHSHKRRRAVLLCVLILMLAAIICAAIIHVNEMRKITSIDNMEISEEDQYPTGSFSIEW